MALRYKNIVEQLFQLRMFLSKTGIKIQAQRLLIGADCWPVTILCNTDATWPRTAFFKKEAEGSKKLKSHIRCLLQLKIRDTSEFINSTNHKIGRKSGQPSIAPILDCLKRGSVQGKVGHLE